jgi:hypothetical protein
MKDNSANTRVLTTHEACEVLHNYINKLVYKFSKCYGVKHQDFEDLRQDLYLNLLKAKENQPAYFYKMVVARRLTTLSEKYRNWQSKLDRNLNVEDLLKKLEIHDEDDDALEEMIDNGSK